MRNTDEMLEEVREKVGAISNEEEKYHRQAREHYGVAREMREKALSTRRSESYLEEDGMPSNMIEAYRKLAEAFDECAAQHIYKADHLCMRLAQRNKTFTINTEE